jgi:DNA-binding GntR family transcriptional regulator
MDDPMTDDVAQANLLQRKHLSEQLYEILEKRIIDGQLPPGTQLSEEAIAGEFGISRSPVRSAIFELERIGLAERPKLRDRRVAIPTAKFISDIYDTWSILEIGRVYLSSLAAPSSDHDELMHTLKKMEAAGRKRQFAQHVKLSKRFHELLHRRCDNRQIQLLLRNFDKYRRWLVRIYFQDIDVSEDAVFEHRKIAQYYINKDLPGLSDVIQRHIQRQRDRVLAELHRDTRSEPATRQRKPVAST